MSIKGNFPPDNSIPEHDKPAMPERETTAIKITKHNSRAEEMMNITNEAHRLLQQHVDPRNISVICSNNEYFNILEQYFKIKNIPFFSNTDVNILVHPFIQKIVQILRYISTENEFAFTGDSLLFEILHYDFFNVPVIEITKLVAWVNGQKRSTTPTTMRKLLLKKANAPAKDLFDTGMNKELKRVSIILEKLIGDAGVTSMQQLFDNTIRNTGVENYIEQSHDSAWLRQLLTALQHFIQIETARNTGSTINQLVDVIDKMEREGAQLLLKKESGDAIGIHFIEPAHIGLRSFDYIFITGANAALNDKDDWLNIIYPLSDAEFAALPLSNGEMKDQPANHLFYAALTGSGPKLFISFTKYDDAGKETRPCAFVTEIISRYAIPIHETGMNKPESPGYAQLYHTIRKPQIEDPGEPFVAPALDKFVMNVSALNNYLDCPLAFYYKNLIRIPTGKNEAMAFGSAIHYALEQLFKNMSAGCSMPGHRVAGNSLLLPEKMIADFRSCMEGKRANFGTKAFYRRMVYGEGVLLNYYDQYINNWSKIVSVERNISGVTINGVPIKGKPDKLEFNGKEVSVIDYKSGNVEKALMKMKPPDDDNPNGGDYWRQAVFYKILVDNYAQKGWKVTSVAIDFIEPDKNKKYRKEKIAISAAAIETVKQQITTTWAKIQAREFFTGCGMPDCPWCNFVKNNSLAVATHIQPQETARD